MIYRYRNRVWKTAPLCQCLLSLGIQGKPKKTPTKQINNTNQSKTNDQTNKNSPKLNKQTKTTKQNWTNFNYKPITYGEKEKSFFSNTSIKLEALLFLFRIVINAYKRRLEAKDLIKLPADLKSESAIPIFEKAWRDDANHQKRWVFWNLFSFFIFAYVIKSTICYYRKFHIWSDKQIPAKIFVEMG